VLDFSADSQLIAIAPVASTAETEIRRSSDGTVIRTLAGGLPAFSRDGKTLAVTDGLTVSLWRRQDLDAAGDQPLRTFEPPIEQASGYGNALSFSPNGQALHAVLGHHLYSWRVVDGTPLGTIANAAAELVSFEAHGAIMSTIAAGQVAGMSRPAALEFSFFLSMPTMIDSLFSSSGSSYAVSVMLPDPVLVTMAPCSPVTVRAPEPLWDRSAVCAGTSI